MKPVTNTLELFELLSELDIKILHRNNTARDMSDIIEDMFAAYASCPTEMCGYLIGALDWLHENGCEFSDVQGMMLQHIKNVQQWRADTGSGRYNPFTEQWKTSYETEPTDGELSEFLKGFKITGGDAL